MQIRIAVDSEALIHFWQFLQGPKILACDVKAPAENSDDDGCEYSEENEEYDKDDRPAWCGTAGGRARGRRFSRGAIVAASDGNSNEAVSNVIWGGGGRRRKDTECGIELRRNG